MKQNFSKIHRLKKKKKEIPHYGPNSDLFEFGFDIAPDSLDCLQNIFFDDNVSFYINSFLAQR